MILSLASPTTGLVGILTGVFLLLYGVQLLADTLRGVIKKRMQHTLPRLSRYPLATFGVAFIGAALKQGSAPLVSLLVELMSASLLPLSAAIVVVLGANMGSTLIVQLLALHVTDYTVELLGLGVAVALFTHRANFRRPDHALFAFALLVLGLAVIERASQPLVSSPVMAYLLRVLADAPLVLVVIGALLTVFLNSSTTAILLVIVLTALPTKELFPLIAALALMLGVNVGVTLRPVFVSLRQGTLARRRLALVHCGIKLVGVAFLLPLIVPLAILLNQIWPHDHVMQVALAYVGFNLALAVIFVPLSGPLARLMEHLWLEKSHQLPEDSVLCILDPQALATPEIAQGLAVRGMLHMADVVTSMFELSMKVFEERPDAIRKRIEDMDDQLDELNAAIKGYLTQLDEETMTEEQVRWDIALHTVVGDLEALGDVITHRFRDLAYRQSRDHILFSMEGWEDLQDYHRRVRETFQHVMAALAAHNPQLVTNCMARKEELKRLKRNLHLRHIRELRAGIANSRSSSAIYLDLLDAMSTVLAHICNMAYALQEVDRTNLPSTGQLSEPLSMKDTQGRRRIHHVRLVPLKRGWYGD